MGQSYVLWRTPLPTCPSDIHRSLDQVGLRGACWRDVSIELGGKGSFQAVKLQRPARTTVCSHSTRDMAAIPSNQSTIIAIPRTSVCPVVYSRFVQN